MKFLPTEKQLLQFIEWMTSQALEGIGGASSASDLADEFRNDPSYKTDDERVAALIKWETAKNFATGFATSVGGALTLPVTIPAGVATSWAIQARMAGAIARIYGHDIKSDRVRTFVLVTLLGNAGKEALKRAGITVAGKVTLNLLKRIPGKLLIEINKQVAFRLITKAGEKGVINLVKLVPFVAGPVGGTVDAVSCRIIGSTAQDVFRRDVALAA